MLPDALADGGSLAIAITRDQPRVTASTSVSLAGLGAQDFEVQTSLEAETGIRLKETYASLKAFGREQDIPANLRYSRKLFVTYLDEDLLVMRDERGVPIWNRPPAFVLEEQMRDEKVTAAVARVNANGANGH